MAGTQRDQPDDARQGKSQTGLLLLILRADAEDAGAVSLRMASDIDAVANYVGKVSTEIQRSQAERDTANTNFEATFTFGGQVAGGV